MRKMMNIVFINIKHVLEKTIESSVMKRKMFELKAYKTQKQKK